MSSGSTHSQSQPGLRHVCTTRGRAVSDPDIPFLIKVIFFGITQQSNVVRQSVPPCIGVCLCVRDLGRVSAGGIGVLSSVCLLLSAVYVSILFYSILFYSVLFYSILFYLSVGVLTFRPTYTNVSAYVRVIVCHFQL